MQVLLDTHALIWFFSGNEKLNGTARNLIEDINNIKYISVASVWEMAIKQSQGKLTLSVSLEDYIAEKLQLEDFNLLEIKLSHLNLVCQLPFYYKDPLDRLLIAQSIVEKISIISQDSVFNLYPIPRVD
ncbi:type II toxin-antitoxin system VapC family toxin [Planktothrix paucivesiculata]|uniref:PilT domain-containing protein n=1 Tax=Planktothrix paucivesiculata PCC 9631 TaxID=671071 RepID=A0A7Z9DY80_9CYAN|nr:type II toxin-antitoxin system VapC family toxin [Planktothrix paucivesiculata]VXD17966.1 PilT domain-containing protein [Planktothrix paucivesiculata PCC 9631]